MPCPAELVVFSHQRWESVDQRARQLVMRLARHWHTHYIEEPVQAWGPARLACHAPQPGVTVIVPHTPLAAPGFQDSQTALLLPLLARHLQSRGACGGVAWLSTPMALPLMQAVAPRAVVVDCMQALDTLHGPPRQLRQREAALMQRADLVFAGGPSLYEAKRGQHAHLCCLPSAVDVRHFAPQRLVADSAEARRAHALQGGLGRPRLGYFGAIDGRLDLALLAQMADARPHWQIVLVGPVQGIATGALPQRHNLHWLGPQDHGVLPHLLAGWDLCLLPFAVDASTRLSCPSQTLEYMAGEKPVVSTPLPDVAQLYGDLVELAPGGPGFIGRCEALLAEPAQARHQRAEAMIHTAFSRSWDRTAADVHRMLQSACQRADRAKGQRAGAAVSGAASA